ncbi:hypothetical protein ACRE_042830 [Hapsidospora chrysogenum ATCC 11550]|uniref:Uncharacterized protein n=1 Tax=Hapsidospora chrysogenum (strain ATCC 11550 / CBS 779.69 / DSM 880 / IAM 14645 / JCM 23072 / IMI 49137) TaxID=857340 RepID=A0A086T6H1_HAPC1|nr:hypothetical protein ACRE_042830 [Hapsidospora chrysogenum ATCC 11550]
MNTNMGADKFQKAVNRLGSKILGGQDALFGEFSTALFAYNQALFELKVQEAVLIRRMTDTWAPTPGSDPAGRSWHDWTDDEREIMVNLLTTHWNHTREQVARKLGRTKLEIDVQWDADKTRWDAMLEGCNTFWAILRAKVDAASNAHKQLIGDAAVEMVAEMVHLPEKAA